MKLYLVLAAALLTPLSAQDDSPPALRGFDPVALCEGAEVPGLAQFRATHGAFTYQFVSEVSLETFRSEPERWAIQWDGGCGRMGPLSGKGSPDRWAVHDGRLFVFASDGCRAGFLAKPERFVPEPKTYPAPTEEMVTAGTEWMEKALAAHGGKTAIDASSVLRLVAERELTRWQHMHELVATADGIVLRVSRWTPPPAEAGDVTESSWVVSAVSGHADRSGSHPLVSDAARGDVRRYAQRQLLPLFWGRERAGIQLLGDGTLGHVEVVNVRIELDGLATTLHLSPEDGSVLGLTWWGRPSDGVTRSVTETFTGWREVDGIRLPGTRTVSADGAVKEQFASDWQTAELAAELTPELAERLAQTP